MNFEKGTTIVIPSFNQGDYIEGAIQSCLEQTGEGLKVLISDDGSTDRSVEILERIAGENPRVECVYQESNLGIVGNPGFLLEKATTEFVVRLDADDRLAPTYVERLRAELEKHPDAGVAHCAISEVDQKGNQRRKRRLMRSSGVMNSDSALKKCLGGYPVAANICMFRKEALASVDYMNRSPDLPSQDFALFARLAEKGWSNVYLQEELATYRVWDDEGGNRAKRKLREIKGLIHLFDEVLEPAWKKRAWNLEDLQNSRVKLALGHSEHLATIESGSTEFQNLVGALRQLGNDQQVDRRVRLIEKGYGKVFIIRKKLLTTAKDLVKNVIAKNPR